MSHASKTFVQITFAQTKTTKEWNQLKEEEENTINSEAIKSRKNAILNVIKAIYKVCAE